MADPTPPPDPVATGKEEAARLAAVRRFEILDAPADGTLHDIVGLAQTVFGTPIASVSIVDTDRVFLAACRGLDGVRQVGTEPGLCTSAIVDDGPYVVTDAGTDLRTLDHPLVRGQLGIRFYAGAPISTVDGHRLGTVNVMDYQPRQVTDTQVTVLSMLAALAARHLDLRLTTIRTIRQERQHRTDADHRADAATDRATAANERAGAADRLIDRLRATAAVHAHAERPERCQLGGAAGCPEPAELKVADSWGDSAWGCLAHVEQTIVNVSSVFIADQELGGLAAYIARA